MQNYKKIINCVSRNYYNAAQHQSTPTNNTYLIPQETHTKFVNSLPAILNNVFTKRSFLKSSGITDHIQKITDYNLSGGKKLRGALTLHTYNILERPENVTEKSTYEAFVLAWAVEMTHSYFVMSDDVQDEAKIRRGKPCWHLTPNVGTRAINDILLLKSFIIQMLQSIFEDHPHYVSITDLFNKAFIYTEIGQHLDYMASKIPNKKYSHFNMDLYNKIIFYKTQFYTSVLPILLGMTLVNKTDRVSQQYVESVCVDISKLFQMQDDYLDCFGEPEVIGKLGTDIQEGKCTWLAVKALDVCNKPQGIVFKSCYGSSEPAHIERIINLYKQLNLPKLYEEEERDIYKRLVLRIKEDDNIEKLSPQIFLQFLNVLNNRER